MLGAMLLCACSLSPIQGGAAGNSVIFRSPCYETSVSYDICYGKAPGYWTSMKGVGQSMMKAVGKGFFKSFGKRELDLTLDLYRPEGVTEKRPLIVFLHGGTFYFGAKDEEAYVDFCRHFSSLGYVTASINYRLGFHFNRKAVDTASADALSDARTALNYLTDNAGDLGIDPDRIFIVGSSSGAITALKLAFQPQAEDRYRICSVANLWGAVYDTRILEGKSASIVSFHGDSDTTVPYSEGYPLTKSPGGGLVKTFSDKMYGSACIDRKAEELGLRHRLYTFPGEGHGLNKDKHNRLNGNQSFIKDRITEFFHEELSGLEITKTFTSK